MTDSCEAVAPRKGIVIPVHSPSARGVLTAAVLAVFAFSASQMAVAPLLSRIQSDFDVTASTAGWTLSAFSLAAVVTTLVGGRSGDEIGHARVLVFSLTVFVVGAVICAVAVNAGILIAGRAVMGCGGAIFPLALTVAAKRLPPGRRTSGIALVSGTLGLGSTVGAPAGGVLADVAGIPAVFIGCAIVAAVALIAVVKVIGFEPRSGPFQFDSAGITVYGTGITCLLVALSSAGNGGFAQPLTLCTFAVGIVLLISLGWVESRVAFPALNFKLLTAKPIAVANVTSALLSTGISGMLALLPMAAQDAHFGGQTLLSVGQSGALLVPHTIAVVAASWLAGRGFMRSKSCIILGCLMSGFGLVVMGLMGSTWWAVAAGGVVAGIGSGFAFTAIPIALENVAPRNHLGQANSLTSIHRMLGAAFGTQIGMLMVSVIGSHPLNLVTPNPFLLLYLPLAASCFVASAVALNLQGGTSPRQD
ncbi:MFS transporter [Pseudarthrobacter sp. NPDC055928]|uniref:MFS transporter n=1 Tax=Pseudarthrobacter sp. NPDC055928 TaxID=3345661 RepID=UPI0035DED181